VKLSRWTTVIVMTLIAVAIGGLVTWLRLSAPPQATEVSVEALLPPGDALTCDELTAEPPPPGLSPIDSAGLAISGTVLSCPVAFDGLLVTYIGEVVGDVLARDGGSWMLVNDDAYALRDGPLTVGGTPSGTNSGLTVWLPDGLDHLADEPGRADLRGDVLEVIGRVNRADPQDGGGLTIRAEEARVLSQAVPLELPIHWRQVGVAALLAVLALVTLLREQERRQR